MFVRKKKNRSGTVSIIVADKSSGEFKELKTVGDFDESAKALQDVKNTIALSKVATVEYLKS